MHVGLVVQKLMADLYIHKRHAPNWRLLKNFVRKVLMITQQRMITECIFMEKRKTKMALNITW